MDFIVLSKDCPGLLRIKGNSRKFKEIPFLKADKDKVYETK